MKSYNDLINRFMLPIAGVALLAVAAWLFFSDPAPFGKIIPVPIALVGVIALNNSIFKDYKSQAGLIEEEENSKKLIVQMKIGLNTYIGETNKKGDPHGKGKLIRPTDKPGYKTVLSCNFKNGLAHGEGTKQFINKEECYQTYIGEWKDGDEYGKGVYFDSEKYVEGEWKDGKFIELKITKNK